MDGGHPPRHRGGPRGATRLGGPHRQGAQQQTLRLVRAHRGQPGGTRPHHDLRAGQAAGGSQRRGGLRRQLHPVVRGRGKRAYGRTIPGFSADRRLATIKQPVGSWPPSPLELPHRRDHPQGGSGAGRRLHHRHQARRRNALCALALAVLAEQAGIPAGSSTSSPPIRRARWATSCAATPWCASSPSPAPPASANC